MEPVERVVAATVEATAEVLEWAEAGWGEAATVVAREAAARAVVRSARRSGTAWRIH